MADTLQTGNVKGSFLFPTKGRPGGVTTEVDKFLATRIGDPAWEVQVAATSKVAQGIYTACLLDAFRRPYDTMVQLVDGKPVVPNRRMATSRPSRSRQDNAVKQRQELERTGTTGQALADHLHCEVLVGGVSVTPAEVIGRPLESAITSGGRSARPTFRSCSPSIPRPAPTTVAPLCLDDREAAADPRRADP